MKYIFYVGQSAPHKNLASLIEAHQQLLANHPSLHLILAGKKDYFSAQLEKEIAAKGYRQVHLPGYVSSGELRWLYEHAAVYAFPSLMEGFGLPGLEAMQYGVPVCSSNATSLPEVYGKAAEYFDPTDVTDIARALDVVLSRPDRRQELIKLGHKQLNKYSWQKMAQETLAAYKSALH